MAFIDVESWHNHKQLSSLIVTIKETSLKREPLMEEEESFRKGKETPEEENSHERVETSVIKETKGEKG